MENLKKKRSEVGGESRLHSKKKRAKKEPSNDGATADDGELEEFLAILKRFQAGFNRFQSKASADERVRKSTAPPPATCSGSWCPAFELEDFKQVDDGRLNKRIGETSQNDTGVGFDLNSDPIVDGE